MGDHAKIAAHSLPSQRSLDDSGTREPRAARLPSADSRACGWKPSVALAATAAPVRPRVRLRAYERGSRRDFVRRHHIYVISVASVRERRCDGIEGSRGPTARPATLLLRGLDHRSSSIRAAAGSLQARGRTPCDIRHQPRCRATMRARMCEPTPFLTAQLCE